VLLGFIEGDEGDSSHSFCWEVRTGILEIFGVTKKSKKSNQVFLAMLVHFNHIADRLTQYFEIFLTGMPARCVSHKGKTFVVYHKVTVCSACGKREFSKISH